MVSQDETELCSDLHGYIVRLFGDHATEALLRVVRRRVLESV